MSGKPKKRQESNIGTDQGKEVRERKKDRVGERRKK